MLKQANTWKGLLPLWPSWSSYYCTTWACNHNGRAKAKRYYKRMAKRRLRQQDKKNISET